MRKTNITYTTDGVRYNALLLERVYNVIRNARYTIKYGNYIIGYSDEIDGEQPHLNGLFSVSIRSGSIAKYSAISDWLWNALTKGEHITIKGAIVECSSSNIVDDLIDLGEVYKSC